MYRTLDLFCGCGGISKGFSNANYNIVAGIDIWDTAIESYKKNNPSHICLVKDLKTYDPEQFCLDNNINKNEIDIIIGSPPCTGYSMGGKRDANDERNNLFKEYVKYLNYFFAFSIRFRKCCRIIINEKFKW